MRGHRFVVSGVTLIAVLVAVLFIWSQEKVAQTHLVRVAQTHLVRIDIDKSGYFWTDGTTVYLEELFADLTAIGTPTFPKVTGADPATFTAVSNVLTQGDQGPVYSPVQQNIDLFSYYRDVNHVYLFEEIENRIRPGSNERSIRALPGIDPASFEVLASTYVKDKSAVYFVHYECPQPQDKSTACGYQLVPVVSADPQTFSLVPHIIGSMLAKDKMHVFWGEHVVPGIDPATLIPLGDGYFAKDSSHVYGNYNKTQVIEGALPSSFVSLGRGYGKDISGVYNFVSGKVEEVDVSSFASMSGWSVGVGPDAKDKNHQYKLGRIVTQ